MAKRNENPRQKHPTKVYRYGCGYTRRQEVDGSVLTWTLSEEDEAKVDEQLKLAHRYRFALWQLHTASRALYRQRRREFFPELAAAEEEASRIEELFTLIDKKEHPEEHQAHKVELQRLRAKLKELRAAAKENEEFNGLVQADHRRMDVLGRGLRKAFSEAGLYSGTYILVEEAAKIANSGRHDPQRPRWDGTGSLGIQIQRGTSAAAIHACKEPWLRIAPPDRTRRAPEGGTLTDQQVQSQTKAWYRVASDDSGKPIFIELPLMMHRDLPSDAFVKAVKLVLNRSGTRRIYSLQLVLESKTFERQEFGGGTVALCLNNDKITYAAEGEEEQTFVFDPRLRKADDLQSIRDKNRNGAIGLVRAWVERQDHVPEWLLEELEKNTVNASCRRSVGLVYRLQREGFLPESLMSKLLEWVKHEDHLYQWQSDLRTNALNARKNAYRIFAAGLRRKYRSIILDSRSLNAPELRSKERNDMAFNELRQAIRASFGSEYVAEATAPSCAEMFTAFYESQRTKEVAEQRKARRAAEAERDDAEEQAKLEAG